MQNKCTRFCLRLAKMQHISLTEFRSINCLPTKERIHQFINAVTSKFVNNNCPHLNEIFDFALHYKIDTRNSFVRLKHPFRKTNTGQKTLSYIGPSLWNNLLEPHKKTNLNTFKHNVKNFYQNQETTLLSLYLGFLLCYYYYYQYYFTNHFLTNPDPSAILN